tara:strand:- start:2339 stop:2584 length:246 start_codon:yes stop_codon:yes gene_type:complete
MAKEIADTRSQFEQDMAQLSNYDSFARVVKFISDEREQSIGELHEAGTEQIQQVSGKILEASKYLEVFGWDELKKRFRDYL